VLEVKFVFWTVGMLCRLNWQLLLNIYSITKYIFSLAYVDRWAVPLLWGMLRGGDLGKLGWWGWVQLAWRLNWIEFELPSLRFNRLLCSLFRLYGVLHRGQSRVNSFVLHVRCQVLDRVYRLDIRELFPRPDYWQHIREVQWVACAHGRSVQDNDLVYERTCLL
jgi:hypothetical protein